MKKPFVSKYLIFLFLFVLATNVFAKHVNLTKEERLYLDSKKYLNVASLPYFPPFGFVTNNEAQGYAVDYMKLLSEKLNIEVKFSINNTWAQYLSMLESNTIDLIPYIAVTEERKRKIDFTAYNHILYVTGMILKRGEKINSMQDLNNKRVAIAKNTFLHTFLEKNYPDIPLIITASTKNSVEAVSLGNADVALGNLASLNYYIQDSWLSNLKIINVNTLDFPKNTELKMGVKKGNILRDILEKAHHELHYSELQNLKLKWMNVRDRTNSPSSIFNTKEELYLKKKEKLYFCVDPKWMPFEKIENKKHIGIAADYMKIFKELLPIPLELVHTESWSSSLEYAKEKKCDLISMLMESKERKEYLNFSRPYINVPLVLATRLDQAFINKISDISNKTVAIFKNNGHLPSLKKQYPLINFHEVSTAQEGLEKVQKKEVFAYIGSLYAMAYNIQEHYVNNIKISGKFDKEWKMSVGLRKDEVILVDIVNKMLNTISLVKEKEILNKWTAVNYQSKKEYTKLIYLTLIFLIILILLFF